MEDIKDILNDFDARLDADLTIRVNSLKSDLDVKVSRLTNKNKAIEDLQYERDLIKNDIIRYIKSEYYGSSANIFAYIKSEVRYEAWLYFNHKDDEKFEWKENAKKDKNSKYSKKESETAFNYLTDVVRSKFDLNKEKFELKELYDFWNGKALEYIFEYKKEDNSLVTIQLDIPDFSMISDESCDYFLAGYRAAVKDPNSDYVWNTIAADLDYRVIRDKIKNLIEENE